MKIFVKIHDIVWQISLNVQNSCRKNYGITFNNYRWKDFSYNRNFGSESGVFIKLLLHDQKYVSTRL